MNASIKPHQERPGKGGGRGGGGGEEKITKRGTKREKETVGLRLRTLP